MRVHRGEAHRPLNALRQQQRDIHYDHEPPSYLNETSSLMR